MEAGPNRTASAADQQAASRFRALRPAAALRVAVVLAGATAAALFWSGLAATELSHAGRASLGVASLAVGLWAGEALDLAVTALLAMTLLYITGASSQPEAAFSGFASPVLFFLIGSAGIGIAAEQSGLTDRLAAWLLVRSRGSGRRLLLELLLSMPLQALFIPSAISRNAVLVPVYDRVLAGIGRPPRLGAAVMLALGVLGPLASSALLSGGTSPVAAAHAIGGFTWGSWLVALAPPYYVWLLAGGVLLYLFCRPEGEIAVDTRLQPDLPRRLSSPEWRVALVSVATSLLWIFDRLTGWPPAIPALLALAALLAPRLGVMSWQRFSGRAPWGTAVVLAGATSLAGALSAGGGAAWMAKGLFGWLDVPRSAPLMALAVFAVMSVITLAIPNRAAAITLGVPLAAAYAAAGPLTGAAAALVVLIAVDAETIYPAQTAANLLAYDRRYFTAGQLARFNLLTMLAAAAVVVLVGLPWWRFVGLPVLQ